MNRGTWTTIGALLAACLLGLGAVGAGAHPADATDVDHDGYKNWADNCPKNYNPKQTDTDKDTPEPVYDAGQSTPQTGPIIIYPHTPVDPGQEAPTDQDPEVGGDSCDIDDDADKIYDKRGPGKPGPDNCRLHANPKQEDADADGKGDLCDDDDDNDLALDKTDNCALISNPDQRDTNRDGKGDACDPTAPKRASSSLLGGPDPNDKKAPAVVVQRLPQMRYAELGRGIAFSVKCSEGCILDGKLTAGRAVLGRGGAQIAAKGTTYVFVKLSKSALKRISRSSGLRATLRVTALDASGNKASKSRALQLRR